MSYQQKILSLKAYNWGRALLLSSALLLCVFSLTACMDGGSDAKSAPCKGLKPFNNIDELLYQFYINIDSDCMFKMSVEELEEIWGIKIYAPKRLAAGTRNKAWGGPDFGGKPYRTEKDAFFVEVRQDSNSIITSFRAVITAEYYAEHATLFPDGKFPGLLPEPLKTSTNTMITTPPTAPSPKYPKNPGVYNDMNHKSYHWLNSDKTRKIALQGIFDSIFGVSFTSQVYTELN